MILARNTSNLAANFDDVETSVFVKHLKNWTRRYMSLKDFLKKYHYEDWKIRTMLVEEMKVDLTVNETVLLQIIPVMRKFSLKFFSFS